MNDISIRAFRAIEDEKACHKYLEGHMHVLKVFGITHITTANIQWITDEDVYVVLAEDTKTGKALAGSRLHLTNPTRRLPIEEAVGYLDQNIHEVIQDKPWRRACELCGLWNSWEIAGLGLGSIYMGMTAIAIAEFLKVENIFALCAPATVAPSLRVGFRIEKELGSDGKFYYPKEDLIATVMSIRDLSLPDAAKFEREYVQNLRAERLLETIETKRDQSLKLRYDLRL